MLEKVITYTDYNDEKRTETFFFNLSKKELADLEYSHSGGLTEWVKRAVEKQDAKYLMDTFTEIIHLSYGVKSPDGRTFLKSEEAYQEFKGTNAYDVLFLEIVTSAEAASNFIVGCMPKDMQAEANKKAKELMDAEAKKNEGNIKAIEKE